jgi:hypothetical protein
MKAIVVREFGTPKMLRFEDVAGARWPAVASLVRGRRGQALHVAKPMSTVKNRTRQPKKQTSQW